MRHWLHMRRWLNDAGRNYILKSCRVAVEIKKVALFGSNVILG